jgi:hypothetical protein
LTPPNELAPFHLVELHFDPVPPGRVGLDYIAKLGFLPDLGPLRVTSVVLRNRRPPVNFRYASLATEIARRCNMSRRVTLGQMAAR